MLQVAANAAPNAVNLTADVTNEQNDGLAQANTGLIVLASTPKASPVDAQQPVIKERAAGPAAGVELKSVQAILPADGQSRSAVVIRLTDAQGQPVAEGVEVRVKIDNGRIRLNRDRVRTHEGLAVVHFQSTEQPGPVTLTAEAGGISGQITLNLIPPTGAHIATGTAPSAAEIAQTVRALRHSLKPGANNSLEAEDKAYRTVIAADGAIHFNRKSKDDQPLSETDSLSFRLNRVRIGSRELYSREERRLTGKDNTAAYGHAFFREEYQAIPGGLEQFFIFNRPLPRQGGNLIIEGEFTTNLIGQYLSNRQGIAFYSPEGVRGQSDPGLLIYSGALVKDADGREIYARMKFNNNRLRLIVPEKWLAEAEYPVVIDPLIGDPQIIADPQGGASEAALAYNSSSNEYLLVWQETGLGDGIDLYAQRIGNDGSPAQNRLIISEAAGNQQSPAVAYNNAANEYLAVWHDDLNAQIHGQRFQADGTAIGSPLALSAAITRGQRAPALAYNPDPYTHFCK